MRKTVLALVMIALVTAALAVPKVFNYQGKLTDPVGVGINDTLDMAVRIYDDPTAGTLLSSDVITNVPIVKGLFDIQYDVDLSLAELTGDLYMELEIDGNILVPRVYITAVPFAMAALYVDSAYYAVKAESLGNYVAGDLLPNDLQGAYDLGDQIQVATGTPVDIRTAYVGPDDGTALEVRTNDDDEEALYVYNAGAGPAIFCSGDLRMNGEIWSNSDITVQLDKNVSASDDEFLVKNDSGLVVFSVNEHGDATIFGELDPKAITFQPQAAAPGGVEGKVYYDDADDELKYYDGATWNAIGAGGGLVPDDVIWNQDSAAQAADFWIDGNGNFGLGAPPMDTLFFDDFEAGLGLWTIDDSSGSGIVWNTTNPGGRIPDPAADISGVFPIVDSDDAGSGVHVYSSMTSPAVDISAYTEVYLYFGCHFDWVSSTDYGNLWVFDGTTWSLLYSYRADTYSKEVFDISAYINPAFQVMFVYNDDDNWAWYWMVDNVTIAGVAGPAPPTVVVSGSGDIIAEGDIGAGSLTLDYSITEWPDWITRLDTINATDHDTVVVTEALEVWGELIADSIQAWGDTVYFDDHISVDGCAKFGGGVAPHITLLDEGFENGIPPAGWLNVDNDGDGFVWFGGGPPGHPTHTGDSVAVSASWDGVPLTPDNWLITTQIDLTTATFPELRYWVAAQDAWYPAEHYYVKLSTTTSDLASFTVTLEDVTLTSDVWEEHIIDLTPYVGGTIYLAWEHCLVTDQFQMKIDDILVLDYTAAAPPAVEICAGDIFADGTIEAAHYRDSSGDDLLRSSDGSVSITEDADGSWNLTTLAGGGCITLDAAYDCGGSGVGRSIITDAGPVFLDATDPAPGDTALVAVNSSLDPTAFFVNTGTGPAIETVSDVLTHGVLWADLGVQTPMLWNEMADTVYVEDKLWTQELVTDTIEAMGNTIFIRDSIIVDGSGLFVGSTLDTMLYVANIWPGSGEAVGQHIEVRNVGGAIGDDALGLDIYSSSVAALATGIRSEAETNIDDAWGGYLQGTNHGSANAGGIQVLGFNDGAGLAIGTLTEGITAPGNTVGSAYGIESRGTIFEVTSTGDAYGGYFDAQNAGTGVEYGIYARTTTTLGNWAGYFEGNVRVTDSLVVDGDLHVLGTIDPIALVLDPVPPNPIAAGNHGIYVNNADDQLYYYDGTTTTMLGGGGGGGTLQDAYDLGNTIITDGINAVSITAPVSGDALYLGAAAGNGIWNDANYWSPAGNIALGTGFYHTNNGLFQSNVDFICRIDADDDADNAFIVQRSDGAPVFQADEYGNALVYNDLAIPTGGINDGVGTGATGQVLTADGAGHFNWANLPPAPGVRFDTLNATSHDTVVVSEALKVMGELIADSIQAVGDIIEVDDSLDVIGGVSLLDDSTFRTDWEPEYVITVGYDNADFTNLADAVAALSGVETLIDLAPGSYAGGVTIPPEVYLRGSGANVTYIGGDMVFNGNVSDVSFGEGIVTLDDAQAYECEFSGDVVMQTYSCVFESDFYSSGTNTVTGFNAGYIRDCYIWTPSTFEGYWSITDCIFYASLVIQAGAGGMTEVHVSGCDLFVPVAVTGTSVFAYFEANRFNTLDGGPGITVGEDGSAEIKANHFVDCLTGVDAGLNTSIAVLANDFTSNIIYAVNGSGCRLANIIGNDINSLGFTSTGINLANCAEGIVKDNNIIGCTVNGISLQDMPDGFIVDNNVVRYSDSDGIILAGGSYQILRNTLAGNGDGVLTFDLNDTGAAPNSIASYNVLDTYNPLGVWAGAFNTNSLGAIWGVSGQLP